MLANPSEKYQRFVGVSLPDRQWPNRIIEKPPIWMSTDLRDGNQALIDPMSIETKIRFFKELVAIGFKEIEVGFPSASETDFQFVRQLIEDDIIPDDVTIEVLTQARYELIEKTIESVKGAQRVILHVYNPLAPQFRRIVYNTDKAGVKNIAVQATKWSKALTEAQPETAWVFQYSPEIFSSTEVEFAKEVCDAVVATWQPTPQDKMILNLPATVEMSTPNTYADQIEWMHRHLKQRDCIVLSVHPHNDRGTAVAAAELAVMAGADRVEGCLFGNGERTGNVDIVTLALNLYSQGVHPGLDFSNIDRIRMLVEECNQLPVHPRHPYVGELVYTAFSGSHQDAIKKGFAAQKQGAIWEVPYLPIDPADLNRSYDAVVRVNSQSGKGGVSYLLERAKGLELPRRLQIEFSGVVQKVSDTTGKEVTSDDIVDIFNQTYIECETPYRFEGCEVVNRQGEQLEIDISIYKAGTQTVSHLKGIGNGPLDAAAHALRDYMQIDIDVVDYHEHGIGMGSDAVAVAYVEVKIGQDKPIFGVGQDQNIISAAIRSLVNGVNRAVSAGADQHVVGPNALIQ
ncbi:MAG: 2-isopropylmalate synthase [Pseudomonadales bacterium]|nr:2-isopropylmalate synthase [Pseudomonadales bacterium]